MVCVHISINVLVKTMLNILKEILEQIKFTNELLIKVEEHLYDLTLPPDMKKWSKKLKEKKDEQS